MLRLTIRAFIALCAAMAVYIAFLNWRGQRTKQELNQEELQSISSHLRAPQKKRIIQLPPIGEISENEVLADTIFFQKSITHWIRENQEATLSWALSLESTEKKGMVFKRFLPTWMKEFPKQCSTWLMDNQEQLFVEKGLIPAIKERADSSPYSAVKLSLQLKKRDQRSRVLREVFKIWTHKNPAQAASYLEDLKTLSEYDEIVLLTLSNWSSADFEKAYLWINESKIDNKDKVFEFAFLLNMKRAPVDHLKWVFKHIEPAKRSAYVGKVILGTYKKNNKALNKFISTQARYKKDMCHAWIAVYKASEGDPKYKEELKKIKSEKMRIVFNSKCAIEFSKKYPGVLIKNITAKELREMKRDVRQAILHNFAEKAHTYALSWAESQEIKEFLKELIFYSQDDSISGMTKNLQLASFFVESYPLPITEEPEIEGLFAESLQVASAEYKDFLQDIETMVSIAISKKLKKNPEKTLPYRYAIKDEQFKDLYISLALINPDYEFNVHSLEFFREIKNQAMRDRVLNFIAWKMDADNAREFAEYAEVNGMLNYSMVSIILDKWARKESDEAGQWLHLHSSNTWYIPACAAFSRTLMQISPPEFKKFAYGIEEDKRNLFVNKLTIVLSESSPELLAILPGTINIKKYLQTSKKEN